MSDKPVYSAQPPQVAHQTGPQRGPNDSYPPEDEIDLRELFGLLWAERVLICGVTAAAAVISVIVGAVDDRDLSRRGDAGARG